MFKNKESSHWWCLSWCILAFRRKKWCWEASLEWPQLLKAEWIQNILMVVSDKNTELWFHGQFLCLHWDLNHVLVKEKKGEHQARICFARSDALVKKKVGFCQVHIIRKIMCAKVQVGVSIFAGIMQDCIFLPWRHHLLGWLGSMRMAAFFLQHYLQQMGWGSPFTSSWVRHFPVQRGSDIAYGWLLVVFDN